MRETDLTEPRQQRCDRGHEKMFLKQTVRSAFVQMVCDAMASLRCTIFELRMTARSKREAAFFGLMSASASSYGHSARIGFGSLVP